MVDFIMDFMGFFCRFLPYPPHSSALSRYCLALYGSWRSVRDMETEVGPVTLPFTSLFMNGPSVFMSLPARPSALWARRYFFTSSTPYPSRLIPFRLRCRSFVSHAVPSGVAKRGLRRDG